MADRENEGPQQAPADEEIGYGKPPKRLRFKVSGNPKGRPKGAKNRKTIVRTVANEMHAVRENGKRRRRSTLELVLLRLRDMALEGNNVRAFEEFHRLTKAYQPQATVDGCGYLVVPAPLTTEEYEEHLKKKEPEQQALYEARMRVYNRLIGGSTQ